MNVGTIRYFTEGMDSQALNPAGGLDHDGLAGKPTGGMSSFHNPVFGCTV